MTATLLLLFVPLSASPLDRDRQPPAAENAVSEQTIAAWVADLRSTDSTKQREAYMALVQAGPKAKSAVPALTKLLGEKGARYDYATEILGAIGPDAKEAVPALLALLPKEGGFGYGSDTVAYALARIDGAKIEATRVLLLSHTKGNDIVLTTSGTLQHYPGQVVPHLITLCGDKDAVVRAKAAYVLGTLKQKPIQKVPAPSLYEKAGDSTKGIPAALEKLLADQNRDVQLAGSAAITRVAPELTDKALACVVALAEKYEGQIKSRIYAYETFNPVPEKAAKVLIPLFDSANESLRLWAINHASGLPIRDPIEDALATGKTARTREAAAMAIGGRYSNAVASVPALTNALKDSEFSVRFAAGLAIIDIGRNKSPANAAAVPVLIEGLQQKEEKVRIRASEYLLRAGPVAKDAVPTLKKLLNDEAPTVQFEAALALVGIDKSEATGTVPALVAGLKMGDGPAIRAAKSLAVLGPVAKDAVPELVKHFDAKPPQLRVFAAEATARVDSTQAEKATAVLVELLKDKKYRSHMVRLYSLQAFQKIGPGAKAAMPTLTDILKDNGSFQIDAAIAMIAIEADCKNPAFDWIRTALQDKNLDGEGYEVLERLSDVGANARPLVPELTGLLKSKTAFYRKNAITTLGAIGPDAKAALPELKVLAEKDPRMDVRDLASAAIKKIEAK